LSDSGCPGFKDFQDEVIFEDERFSDTDGTLPLTLSLLTIPAMEAYF
jgi:hypothetical protein